MCQKKVICLICAKNEEKYIKKTLTALFNQSHPPNLTIIVDDGSEDRTIDVIRSVKKIHPNIKIIRRRNRGFSALGTPLMANTYNSGLKRILKLDFDYLLIIGADTVLPSFYIEKLVTQFQLNPRLGLISGMNPHEPLAPHHASGSGRMMRAEIIKKMGLLPRIYGWESYEEIFTMAIGYQVKHFPDIPFHLQRLGGTGHHRSYRGWGKAMYELGYPFLYTIARCISNAKKGDVSKAIHLLAGYLSQSHVPEKIKPVREFWKQYLKWYFSRLPLRYLRILN